MIEATAHRHTAITGKIVFDVPRGLEAAWRELIRKGARHGDYFALKVGLVRRTRSTGEGSQNHHINGHVAQIAQETGNDFLAVKMFLKAEAIGEGWPFSTLPDGSVVPRSESEATVEEASILIETIHRFAAEWNITLREE